MLLMSERYRETNAIWNWLPAFRAVAETEHLPSAGELLGVSPPALSRSVKNLEEAVGRELFLRNGRSLELNDDGLVLAAAVRVAMRTIHDALSELDDATYRGHFKWASIWSMSGLVLDVLAEAIQDHPRLIPIMLPIHPDDVVSPLLRGELDLIVTTQRVEVEGVKATRLGQLTHSIYCGPNHVLATKNTVSWDDLTKHAFAAPIANIHGVFEDGWPPEKQRKVVFQFSQMESGYQACLAGHVLAVLPDKVALGLVKLKAVEASPSVYALHRTTLSPGVVENITEKLASLL